MLLRRGETAGEKKSFIASFQSDIEDSFLSSSDAWIEFSNKVPPFKEFTICHWIKIRKYNVDSAACLWSYCTIRKVDGKLNCLQLCLFAVFNTQNRNLRIDGSIPFDRSETTESFSKDLRSYMHRTWTHLCWSFSTITGENQFYQNGESLGKENLNVSNLDWIVKGKDDTSDTAFIFGQEQDSLRGGFEKYEAYIGDMSEFNFWNFTLNDSDIKSMAECKTLLKGNIVDWNPDNLVVKGVITSNISDYKTFCTRPYQYVIFPEKLRYPEAKETCEIHGGILAVPKSIEESEKLLNIVSQHENTCLDKGNSPEAKAVWIGTAKVDYEWYEVSSSIYPPTRLTYKNLLQNHSTSHSKCMYMRKDGAWMIGKYGCAIMSLCTICEIRKQPVFSWKGSCDTSSIDWNFYPHIDSTHQIRLYEGYRYANITFDEHSKKWNISGAPSRIQTFIAEFTPNQFTTKHPVGRKHWLIQDSICRTSSPKHSITFSVCDAPLQFTCDSGACISIDKRCNEQIDCSDGSDEENCSLISIPSSYNKAKSPGIKTENSSFEIEIQTNIATIDSIDTVSMVVTSTIEVVLRWFDDRLLFENLFPDKDNLVPFESTKQLWTPLNNLVHENAIVGKITHDNEYELKIIPTIAQDFDASKTTEDRLFAGSDNRLELYQRMKIAYNCVFKVKTFPFDVQNCNFTMKIYQRKNGHFVFVGNGYVQYKDNPIVDQFSIGQIWSRASFSNKSTTYTVIIPMTRIFTNQLLNTFIPTFILWLFGYATLFIVPDEDGFGNRFMGAGTSLLVIATLLNAVNGDLPKTSYMKFIDLWFLWHVVSTLAIIIYHIILDRIRTSFESEYGDNVIPFETLDGTKSLKENGWMRINKINQSVIIIFLALNGLFYVVYFYITLT